MWEEIIPAARFWSRRVIAVMFSGGIAPAAARMQTNALVLHGFPTTTTLTSLDATSARMRPCSSKMALLALKRSLRCMSFERGRAPTSSATSTSANATLGSVVQMHPEIAGGAESCISIPTARSFFSIAAMSSKRSSTAFPGKTLPRAM